MNNVTNKIRVPQAELLRLVDELDRVIHRVRPTQKKNPQSDLWQSLQGLWKGKLSEDPLAYQRRIRNEE